MSPTADVTLRIDSELARTVGTPGTPPAVVWVEATVDDARSCEGAWRQALPALNWRRDFLDSAAPAFVVLAGPPEFARLVSHEAPDLWSVAVKAPFPTDVQDLVTGRPITWLHLSDIHVPQVGDWQQDLVGTLSGATSGGDGCASSRVVILGRPGSGKSTLVSYLALRLASAPCESLPFVITIRDYLRAGQGESPIAWLVSEATVRLSVQLTSDMVGRILECGNAIFLVDGLDEVGDEAHRARIRNAIVAFSECYPSTPVLVTSRITGYDRAPLPADRFDHATLQGFTDRDLEAFATAWYEVVEPVDPVMRDRGRSQLLAGLEADPRIKELARTPLLATLIALVHRYEARIPSQRAKIYDLCVRMVLETWPALRGRRFAGIDEGRQRACLEALAFEILERPRAVDRAVLLPRNELVKTLSRILTQGDGKGTPDAGTEHLAEEWVEFLASENGVLVEHAPGVFGFFHLSFLEYLGGREAIRRELAGGHQEVARFILDHVRDASWREPLLLGLSSEADNEGLIDAVVQELLGVGSK